MRCANPICEHTEHAATPTDINYCSNRFIYRVDGMLAINVLSVREEDSFKQTIGHIGMFSLSFGFFFLFLSTIRFSAVYQCMAFQILSRPWFLVGSIRLWEGVEYLVLCLSPKAELVPQLPPLLIDPFESLSKKDRAALLDQPEEKFEVVNSKPVDDLWLFIARLPKIALDKDACIERILARSAEFSQMTISFEVEANMENGLFVCHALLDN
ncbi:uncharacterized protein DEA37_0001233 [Paragonimus westermani]|uniref:Uncharacterized protein n=1 Tax=Paragonimus westermani TaxID=34504 RepID=A0A5J4N9S0_9TREM|nr:uncharacterized protein DEA37_0001233 [Paragonimus westermani]